jgi:hypothetical protein
MRRGQEAEGAEEARGLTQDAGRGLKRVRFASACKYYTTYAYGKRVASRTECALGWHGTRRDIVNDPSGRHMRLQVWVVQECVAVLIKCSSAQRRELHGDGRTGNLQRKRTGDRFS